MSSTSNQYEFRFGHDRITWGVQSILLATTAAFALQLLLDIPFGRGGLLGGPVYDEWLAFNPATLLHGYVWSPLTYIFIHFSLSHLFFNMLMLYFFGPDVERVLGTRQFISFYLLCGALGVMANFVAVSAGGSVSVVGASGATLGVLVAFAFVEPDRKVILFPIPIPVTARALVIIFVVFNLMSAVGGGGTTSIATHFGGMVVGYLYMKYRPAFSAWKAQRKLRRRVPKKKSGAPPKADLEELGKEIDNIFKFQDKDRR
jgi:membrane associated rhomboid family serine protease